MRITNPQVSDFPEVRQAVLEGRSVTVQYSDPVYTPDSLSILNDLCKELDSKLCVRFYGHYKSVFDCSHLRRLGSVRNLHVDCLDSVVNFAAMKELDELSHLHVGIFELAEPDFLSWPNLHRLSSLSLAQTRRKNLDLAHLAAYDRLTSLFIGGHTKNLDRLARAGNLTHLTLNLPSSASIGFLNSLPHLKELQLLLGGRANLDELRASAVETLEIIRVRGFSLRKLMIEDQIQITELDVGDNLANLRHLRIYGSSMDFEDFVKQDFPDSLKILAFHTTRERQDTVIRERLAEMGYMPG